MSNAPPAELISDSLPATTRSLLILRLPFTHAVPLSSELCAFDKQQNPKQSRHFRTFRPRVANPNQASDERSRLAGRRVSSDLGGGDLVEAIDHLVVEVDVVDGEVCLEMVDGGGAGDEQRVRGVLEQPGETDL